MLSDPEQRAQYDAELSNQKQQADDLVLSEVFCLEDLTEAWRPEGSEYYHVCRCGGFFSLSGEDLKSDYQSFVLPCSNCSLYVKVERMPCAHTRTNI